MIDPVSAFVAAQAAIKGIKAVIAMGRDVQGITGDLMKFFDAKDTIAKSAANRKPGQSVNSEAMQSVMHLHNLQRQEQELKEMLIYSGNGQIWDDLLQERSRITRQRKADALALEKKQAASKKEIEEVLTYVAATIALVSLLGSAIYLTLELTK